MEILKHVDISDLIDVQIIIPNPMKPGEIQVNLEAMESGKQVIVDPDALVTLNRRLTEKCQQFEDARDPKVRKYIQEFVTRMCSEWHRNGLLVIDVIKDAQEDPYAAVRHQYGYMGKN